MMSAVINNGEVPIIDTEAMHDRGSPVQGKRTKRRSLSQTIASPISSMRQANNSRAAKREQRQSSKQERYKLDRRRSFAERLTPESALENLRVVYAGGAALVDEFVPFPGYRTHPGVWGFFKNFTTMCTLNGSVLPNILPQVCLVSINAALASFLLKDECADLVPDGHMLMAVPLAFLVVFKSTLSYGQYFDARAEFGNLVRSARSLSLQALTYITDGDGDEKTAPERKKKAEADKSKICRLVQLFYFLVVRHERSTGPATCEKQDPQMLALVDVIKSLVDNNSEEAEFEMLFMEGKGDRTTEQALADLNDTTRGTVLLCIQWIMQTLSAANQAGRINNTHLLAMDTNVNELMKAFNAIDRIDKMLFPFPYAQLVKVFLFFFCFSLPFYVHATYGTSTTFGVSILTTIGYFGIDEVSELLEDPFGTDKCDLPLDAMGIGLYRDINLFQVENGRHSGLAVPKNTSEGSPLSQTISDVSDNNLNKSISLS